MQNRFLRLPHSRACPSLGDPHRNWVLPMVTGRPSRSLNLNLLSQGAGILLCKRASLSPAYAFTALQPRGLAGSRTYSVGYNPSLVSFPLDLESSQMWQREPLHF